MILSVIPVIIVFFFFSFLFSFFFLVRSERFAYLFSWPVTARIPQAGKGQRSDLISKKHSKCQICHLLFRILSLPSAESK